MKPHRVGDVITYIEKTDNKQNGGAARFNGMLLRALGEPDSAVLNLPQQAFIGGQDNPLGFFLVDVDVLPRWAPAKGDKPAKWVRKEVWKSVDITDEQLDAIEKARAAVQLPPLKECLEALAALAQV